MRTTKIGRRLAIYTARGLRPGKHQDQGHAQTLAGYAKQAVEAARDRRFVAAVTGVDESWHYTLPEQFRDDFLRAADRGRQGH